MTHDPDNPERDPVVAAVWREHSAEMPPAELDAAILAAAHRAVSSAPQDSVKRAAGAETPDATRPQRWWMPLAAAATIGAIALGILQTLPQEPSVATHSASDMPTAASPPVSSSRDNLAMQQQGSDAPRAESETPPPQARSVGAPPPAAPMVRPTAPPANGPAKLAGKVIAQSNADSVAATPPAPAVTAPAAAPQPFPAEMKRDADESGAATDRASRTLATQPSGAPTSEFQGQRQAPEAPALARSPPPAAAPAPERMAAASDDKRQRNIVAQSAPMASGAGLMAKKAASAEPDSAARDSAMREAAKPIDVDAWIVRIRKLHDDGKLADAAKELVAMRAAVPDADRRLPPELRAWAATVKP